MSYWVAIVVGVILLVVGAVGLTYAVPRLITMWHLHQMQKKMSASVDSIFEERTADGWAADLEHADAAVRSRAIFGLANEQDRRSIAPLTRELQRLADAPQGQPPPLPKEGDVKQAFDQMAGIFAKLHGTDATSQLLSAAAAMPDPGYVPSLELLLKRDDNNEMIRNALAAARNLPDAAGPATTVDGSGDAARLDSPDVLGDLKRLRAAQAAASPDDLLKGLHAASAGTQQLEALAVLLRECARRPEPAMAEAAARWAVSDDPKKRMAAAMALGGLAPHQSPWETIRGMSDKTRATLRKLTEDPVAEVARAGVGAIFARALGDKDEIKPLMLGRHPDAGLRALYVEQAYGITEWFDASTDVDALLGFLADPSPAVRTEAATRISHILDSDDHGGAFDRSDVRAALRVVGRDDTAPLLLQTRAISILAKLGDDVTDLVVVALGKSDTLTTETFDHLLVLDEVIRAKPNRRYIVGLERFARKIIEIVGEDGQGALDDVLALCRKAR